MKSKLVSNPAKKILCLALCAIMLIAMLPVMTVPAYAGDELVELYSVWVEYVDIIACKEIAPATLLDYADIGANANVGHPGQTATYSIDVPNIEGFTLLDVRKIEQSKPSGPKSNVQIWVGNASEESLGQISTIQGEIVSISGAADGVEVTFQDVNGNSWTKYRVYYRNNKTENGYIRISGYVNGPDPDWVEMYYYDDLTNGEFSIDLNKAGYRIAGVYNNAGVEISIPNDGVITGTLNLNEVYDYDVLYTPDTSAASFNSVLLLNENSIVPNVAVDYSIAPGTGIAAVPGTSMAVLSPNADTGVTGTPTISNAVFAPGDATVTSVEGVTIDAGEKAVVKPISIDFSGVSFAQPGIFRYVITEPSSGNNMTYDTQLNDTTNGTRYQRVLDVYVVRNASDEYEIGGFVLHEVAGAVNEGATTAADKSSGFVNEYNTTGLTLECQVEGNQSSIDKYFAYTITMQNPGNSEFNVSADWSNASSAQNPVANPATSYTTDEITAANTNEWTSNADGSMSKTIYLKDGQKVALDGIPVGTSYSITVAEEDYGPSWVVGSDNGSNDATGNRTLTAVEDVVFTLVREGVVPTGVALSILPGVILMGAAAAFLFVMKKRKREEGANA